MARPRTPRRTRLRQIDGGRLIPALDATAVGYARNLLLGTRLRHATNLIQLADIVADPVLRAAAAAIVPRAVAGRRTSPAALVDALERALPRTRLAPEPPEPPGEPVAGGLALLAEVTGLDETERALLQLVFVCRCTPGLGLFLDGFGDLSLVGMAEVCAAAVARPQDQVQQRLSPKGRLCATGLLRISKEFASFQQKLQILEQLADLLLAPGLDRDRLLSGLLPLAPRATLGAGDYPQLSGELEVARRLLGAGLKARTRGLNVLFHGVTGGGKTELSRLLAEELGVALHVAGREGEDGESPSAEDRLASLLLGNHVLASGRSLLLFDELEDVFDPLAPWGGARAAGWRPSKQWLNHLLETNPVPTVWIANHVERIDPAFRRRFSYAIAFRPLAASQRARVWRRHLGERTSLDAREVGHLAEQYAVSPGQIATAVSSARLVAGGEPQRATIEQVIAPLDRLVQGAAWRPQRSPQDQPYVFAAANASCDLEALVERLVRWQPGEAGVSLCLYGPPGTGKSELVHHLGRRMGRRVLVRRVSDLLSMWLGDTERRLAESFEEAERDGALLLLDEADSFLRDRRGAQRSWEVTQANELLQQLESFRGFVACTTNLFSDLDQAALRRFVFKVELRFLEAAQARLMFRGMLEPLLDGIPPPEDEAAIVWPTLDRLRNLTPGDFAVVARRHAVGRALAEPPSLSSLVHELRGESEAKERATRPIGF